MMIRLPVGRGRAMVDLRGLRVQHLAPNAPERHAEAAQLTRDALHRPLDGITLEQRCRGKSSVTIVVPDATRKAEIPRVLGVVLAEIRAAGCLAPVNILVACGTHQRPTAAELDEILGPLPANVEVTCHDSRSDEDLVQVGELAPGVPVRLNRLLIDSDMVMTIGAVRHHYFAGFGGGPKMVFPGCGGYREIQLNHARVLDFTARGPQLNPGCQPGRLAGNPVAEQIALVAEIRPPDLALCLVCDAAGKVAWAGAGPWQIAFTAAVERARRWYELPPVRFRFLVACGGGHPSDNTLIQSHKGLDAASRFLEDGGELLYFAAMTGGLGSAEMAVFVDEPEPSIILARLRASWVQYGHTTLRIVDKTHRARVHLVSELDMDCARRLGFEGCVDPARVVDRWRSEGAGETVGVMTGAAVYPKSN